MPLPWGPPIIQVKLLTMLKGLFNTNYCCHDRNNLASTTTEGMRPLNIHFLKDEYSAAKNKHYIA
jgi:hypothetical protein